MQEQRNPDNAPQDHLKLRLYVKDQTFDMRAALRQVYTYLQEQRRARSYTLEVLDTGENREQALADHVPFIPCLIRVEPGPCRIIPVPARNQEALDHLLFDLQTEDNQGSTGEGTGNQPALLQPDLLM